MNEQKIERPLCLALEDARSEIFAVINMTAKKHHLPFYLLDSIVADAARQVSDLAKKERDAAAIEYEKTLNKQRGENDE